MKSKKIISLILVAVMTLSFFCISGSAIGILAGDMDLYTYADMSKPETKIYAQKSGAERLLVLPSTVSKENFTLFAEGEKTYFIKGELAEIFITGGESFNLDSLCKDGNYLLKITCGISSCTLRILFESNISALYLSSEDPVNQGRFWVESSLDKSNKAKGSAILIAENGEVVYQGNLTQIKGRGNTTWDLEKKPYQIKLENKADLLRTGNNANKSKTWVLLANYLDPAGIRNTLALALGRELGMPMNVQGESVNLYYDGEYRGLYMLTEKVEVGSGRVDVADLDDENEKANPDVKMGDFPIAQGTTANGATYTYCEGMVSPADITGGYLLEMDYEVRALEEISYFRTKRNNYVVVKSPEYASKEEMDYIATLYQDFEDSVFNDGINPQTGKKYSDYIDERSLACYYMICEFSKTRDSFQSSAYLHKKPGEDKFYMGPLWDFDMSFGKGSTEDMYVNDNPYGLTVSNYPFGYALIYLPEFYETLKSLYINEFGPLILNTVIGPAEAVGANGEVRSLRYYKNLLATAGQNNSYVWHGNSNWANEVDLLYDYVSQRYKVLSEYFEGGPSEYVLPDHIYYDVLSSAWYFDVVTTASKSFILKGDGNGFFRPLDNVTRAQGAQSILNLSGLQEVAYNPVFSDVSSEDWFAGAVSWASKNRFLNGYTDGTFKPNDPIKREEFINLLYMYTGAPTISASYYGKYADADMVTAKNAIDWALKEGIIQGSYNYINPQGAMTRAEMAAILVRYLDIYKT